MILGNSAYIFRLNGSDIYFSNGLIEGKNVQAVHVDIKFVNANNLVAFIESILQRNLLDQYFINYFPYSIDVGQILFICGVSFALSILATLVPAFKVSKLDPSEILRYE